MLRRSKLVLVSLVAAAFGCGAAARPAITHDKRAANRPISKPGAAAPASLTAHRFAEVSDVIGPYVGHDGDVALAAWAEAGSATGHSLFVTAIDEQGQPASPKRVGNLAGEVDLVLVRGFGAAAAKAVGQPRFAVITTHRAGKESVIDVTALRADGTAVWGPSAQLERSAHITWVGFVVAGDQPLLLWAEQAFGAKSGEPVALYTLPIAADGKQVAPSLVAAKACVWQVAGLAGQAALASVKPGPNGCGVGSVAFDLLSPSGKSLKSVELAPRAGLDLDMVAGPESFVLAWSDREQLESRVVTAVVDARGTVRSPVAAAAPVLGEQAVVALSPGASAASPAFLVWESLADQPEGARFFEISALDAAARASGNHSRLLYARVDGSAPEFTPYAGGLAALTLAPACGFDDSCEGVLPVPTFVALDAALKVQASEPLLLDALGGRAADLGWGLTCRSRGCFALAAPSKSPAALFTVPLPLRPSVHRAAAEEEAPAVKPRVVSSDVLMRAGSPLSQIIERSVGGRSLLGLVTDFDPTTPWQKLTKPAEDGRLEPLRARVALRAFAGDGARAAIGDEQVVSLRAHSLGGLALLSDPSAKNTLAVWSGLDKGEPQVFLTLLGLDGKRGQQRMLTHKTGDTSDVSGLAIDSGYLIGWVDERSGDPEIYTARVSHALEKASPEQRITTADGAASDLMLTQLAGKPYAIWADARTAEEPGWADIYGAFLRPSDAARDGGEHRLSNTRPHSFSPRVGELAGTPILAWLEEAADGSPGSVRLVALSPNGELSGNVSVVPLAAGAPRGLGIECGAQQCRVAVTVEIDGRGELHGFEWRPGSDAHATRLSALGAPGAAVVPPLVRAGFVYVADLRDRQGLVRRLGIDW